MGRCRGAFLLSSGTASTTVNRKLPLRVPSLTIKRRTLTLEFVKQNNKNFLSVILIYATNCL